MTRPHPKVSQVKGARMSPHTPKHAYKVKTTHLKTTAAAVANTPVLIGKAPRVQFTPEAWEKMWLYIELVDTEIGWYGTVEKPEDHIFLITDVFLLEQEVTGTTTVISKDGQTDLTRQFMAETCDDPQSALAFLAQHKADPDLSIDINQVLIEEYGADLFTAVTRESTLRFWGHSHGTMAPNPSPQDDIQMELFEENQYEYMIRGIFNQQGQVRIDVYDFVKGMIIQNVSHGIKRDENEAQVAAIKAEIQAKVTEAKVSHYDMGAWYGYAGYQHTHRRNDACLEDLITLDDSFDSNGNLVDDEGNINVPDFLDKYLTFAFGQEAPELAELTQDADGYFAKGNGERLTPQDLWELQLYDLFPVDHLPLEEDKPLTPSQLLNDD